MQIQSLVAENSRLVNENIRLRGEVLALREDESSMQEFAKAKDGIAQVLSALTNSLEQLDVNSRRRREKIITDDYILARKEARQGFAPFGDLSTINEKAERIKMRSPMRIAVRRPRLPISPVEVPELPPSPAQGVESPTSPMKEPEIHPSPVQEQALPPSPTALPIKPARAERIKARSPIPEPTLPHTTTVSSRPLKLEKTSTPTPTYTVKPNADTPETLPLRPSRRSRSNISYTEPSLNTKMRRPTKELMDAVIKPGDVTTSKDIFIKREDKVEPERLSKELKLYDLSKSSLSPKKDTAARTNGYSDENSLEASLRRTSSQTSVRRVGLTSSTVRGAETLAALEASRGDSSRRHSTMPVRGQEEKVGSKRRRSSQY